MFGAMASVCHNEIFYYFGILHLLSILFQQAFLRSSPHALHSFACRQTFTLRCVTLTFSCRKNSYPKHCNPNSVSPHYMNVITSTLNDPPGKYLYKSLSIIPLKPPKTYISLQGQTQVYTTIKFETYQKD